MQIEDQLRIIAQQLSIIQKQNIKREQYTLISKGIDPAIADARYINYNGDIVESRVPGSSPTLAEVRQNIEEKRVVEAFQSLNMSALGIEVVEKDD